MAQAAEAQINVRIDRALKEQGDTALASAGFSPSQAVRLLWGMAAERQGNPAEVASLFEPQGISEEEEATIAAERKRKLSAAQRGTRIVQDALAEYGLDELAEPFSTLSYEDMKRMAYEDEHGEEMGWS